MYVHLIAGNYSATGFEMILTRRMSHYMITYYLPSSLFVVVSWTSFLIPSEDIQGRMALLVTLFLVLVRHWASSTSQNKQNQHTYLKVNLTIYLNRALFNYYLLPPKLWKACTRACTWFAYWHNISLHLIINVDKLGAGTSYKKMM